MPYITHFTEKWTVSCAKEIMVILPSNLPETVDGLSMVFGNSSLYIAHNWHKYDLPCAN